MRNLEVLTALNRRVLLRGLFFVPALLGSQRKAEARIAHAAPTFEEPAVFAAMLLKIVPFIEWPIAAPASPRPFEIVFWGRSPVEARLRHLAYGQKLHGRPVVIRNASKPSEWGRPDLLFIGEPVPDSAEKELSTLRNQPVLFVGASPGICGRLAAVNLVVIDGRVRFEISRVVLRRQQLTASYRLLKLARLVDEGDVAP